CALRIANTLQSHRKGPGASRDRTGSRGRQGRGTVVNNCLTSIKSFIIYKEEVHRKFSKNFQSNVLTNEGKKNIL
ncbi:hypothetical protein, partial [Hungatella hathewayi]|uniref:hypothetical protein n=2 Tax=Hungatella TaxID=1649459 RepID=UPI001A9A82D2